MKFEHGSQYRWEFLRRNQRYRRDFCFLQKHILKSFPKLEPLEFQRKFHGVWLALNDFSPEKVASDFPGVPVKRVKEGFIELGRFKEKWSVIQPQNPDIDEAPDFVSDAAPKVPPVEIFFPSLLPRVQGENKRDAEEVRFLNLRIDLGAPCEEILKQVQDVLDLQRKIYAEAEEIKMKNPLWARLDQCLVIYDEVIHNKKSLQEGCQILFPEFNNFSENEKNNLLNKSQYLLDDAKKFVEMGFEVENSSDPT